MLSIAIFLLVLIFLYLDCRKPKGYPPGPRWWPVFGSALELARIYRETKCFRKTCIKLQDKYGPIVSLKVNKKHIVILNNAQGAREMFFNKDCEGKLTEMVYPNGVKGFLMLDGQLWAEQRQIIIRYLREFGHTGIAMLVEDETRKLLQHFKTLLDDVGKSLKKNDLDMWESHDKFNVVDNKISKQKLQIATEEYREVKKVSETKEVIVEMVDISKTYILNIIWKIIFDKRLGTGDQKSAHIDQKIIKTLDNIFSVDLCFKNLFLNNHSILHFIMSKMSNHESFVKEFKEVWDFTEKKLQHYKKTLDPNAPRGLVDAYLIALRSKNFSDSLKNESQIVAFCLDLFVAGIETTPNSLAFGFLYLILCPRVQKKAQEEIDRVIGRDRLPTLADKSKLPYLQAVVLESVRMFLHRSIINLYRALRDTTILGYKIPKDTIFMINLFKDHSYNDPEDFQPERFIDNNGNIAIPNNYFLFGTGKRFCVGEMLAKSSIFITITTLLQKFNFSVVPGEPQPSLDIVIDQFAACPKPYRALLSLRA